MRRLGVSDGLISAAWFVVHGSMRRFFSLRQLSPKGTRFGPQWRSEAPRQPKEDEFHVVDSQKKAPKQFRYAHSLYVTLFLVS